MDSGLDVSRKLGALLHMGIDEYPSGFAPGEKMKALGTTSGACVNMEVGNVVLDQRCQGFADALGDNSQVIATSIDPPEIKAGVGGRRATVMAMPSTASQNCGGLPQGAPERLRRRPAERLDFGQHRRRPAGELGGRSWLRWR